MWYGYGQAPPAAQQQGWLSHERITYVRDLLEVIFLLLGLPYLAYRLVTDPIGLLEALGKSREG